MRKLPVVGYEGQYEVSEDGSVYSVDRVVKGVDGTVYPFKAKRKNVVINKNTKYFMVNLWKANKGTSLYVHRVVGQAFIPNPFNKPEINHIDGDKQNNYLENLEWVTRLENIQHAISTGLRVYTNKLTEAEFLECLHCVIGGESYLSISKRVPYQVPFLSVKVREVAKKYNLVDLLDDTLAAQRTNRASLIVTKKHRVSQYTVDGAFIKTHQSLREAARSLGKKSSGSISNALNPYRSQETAYGYIWLKEK